MQVLYFARLPCMQQVFLLGAIESDGNNGPAALLQAGCSGLQVVVIAKEEVMVQGIRVGERLVEFFVGLRAARCKPKKPANAFKHIFLKLHPWNAGLAETCVQAEWLRGSVLIRRIHPNYVAMPRAARTSQSRDVAC